MSPKKRKHEESFNQSSDEDSDADSYTNHSNKTFTSTDDKDEWEGIVEPKTMMDLVTLFKDYLTTNKKGTTLAKQMREPNEKDKTNIVQSFLEHVAENEDVDDLPDAETFVKSFKKYLLYASKAMTLNSASDCVIDFVSSEEAVKCFPGFPKPPPNLLNYYLKKHGIKTAFGMRKEGKNTMDSDIQGRVEAKQEVDALEERYLHELETFAEENQSKLTSEQQTWLKNKIRNVQKKVNGPTMPKTPKIAKTKNPKTPFEFYKKTMVDKYTHLEAEAREKKLKKKFDRLDEATRDIFEKLAMR